MSAYTSGPWMAYLQGDSTAYIVATVSEDRYGRHESDVARITTGEANARLIAAAPELLEALKIGVAYIAHNHQQMPRQPGYPDADPLTDFESSPACSALTCPVGAARAAIAKAEGREQHQDSRGLTLGTPDVDYEDTDRLQREQSVRDEEVES